MSNNRPSLPAYVRLPDGLRFAGTARLTDKGFLNLSPKQAVSPLPPEGLPVEIVIAGLPDDDEGQLKITGSIESASARELLIAPDDDLPDRLVEAMDPESIVWLPSAEDAEKLIADMCALGEEQLQKAMRRFLVDLGDRLFDLSTSSRYGISGQHAHYDALNMLKRNGDEFIATFMRGIARSLETIEKTSEGESFADLETASAKHLDLVGLDEMDQKLAVDKTVNGLIDRHRVDLECLTIRAALIADLEPRRARTPFHPAYVVQAFMDALEPITDSTIVTLDSLKFFRESYAPELDKLYPALNQALIQAGIEPGLEEDIRENGSLLNPVEKRIIKSTVRTRNDSEAQPEATGTAAGQNANSRSNTATGGSSTTTDSASAPSQATSGSSDRRETSSAKAAGGPRNKHDAMYDAVLNALDTRHDHAASEDDQPGAGDPEIASAGGASSAPGSSAAGTAAPGASQNQTAPTAAVIDQQQLLNALLALQASQPKARSLGELPPLEQLIKNSAGDGKGVALERDGANRLSFVDNVFQTLHNNFEVSEDMAPSLARLRVPIARLSLQEPRFFAQPEHPAYKLLDKLSMLASADHTVSRSLQSKVAALIDRVANEYTDDSSVFANAQSELDALVSQQHRVLDRNIARVISGQEGQEKLGRAQRRVEQLIRDNLDGDKAPEPLVELLDDGWRSALVQLALREGDESVAWREESALLKSLIEDFRHSTGDELPEKEIREMQLRLRALNKRLNVSNPGSVAHERALRHINAVLTGTAPLATSSYRSPISGSALPDKQRVEQLPRLRRWLKRVQELEPGARLRYRGKDGRRRHMRLIWVSDDRERFAFVNERGQKIAELTAVQLARQLSQGAQLPSPIDEMGVLDQSMYETLEQAQKTLSFERNRDRLTKLINGESLMYQLQRTLRHAQVRGSIHTFMLLDIDNFTLVNDVFDDTSGDQVLSEFANLLGQMNDRRALTARMQDDEFGILLTYRSTDEARRIADKIRNDIAASSLTINGEAISFTVSMGISEVSRASSTPESILDQARGALDLAKTQGRNQVVVYDIDQQDVLDYKRQRDASRKRLDDAMSTDSLVLRAQPIVLSAVSGESGASHRYEILLSLRDDAGELQSPQDFIMSAERFGYVTLVDRWVLKEVFSWISQLMDSQKEVPELSINLSGTSITDNDFLDYVLEQISEYGVGTSKLCFEITETGAIDNLPRAADFVRTLKNIGCKFSLDDFGTGLASHKYLKELPVDYVKIDGTFITDIHNNRTDYAMTKSINDLAHFLGQKTVAECVESLEIVPALREIGVDYLQGWGIGMPRELHQITDELANLET